MSASTLILGPVRDTGVGVRTAHEVGLEMPPRAFTVSPAAIGKAAVRAIVRDRAEIALVPGPGRTMRAVMDRFPGLGPGLNRVAGAERTMLRVADYREREARLLSPAANAGQSVSTTRSDQPRPGRPIAREW